MTLSPLADIEKHEALSLKNPLPNSRYRDPVHIIAGILSIAKKPCLMGHITKRVKIGYARARRYLSSLVAVDLLEVVEKRMHLYTNSSMRWKTKQRVYMTTEKGLRFLQLHKDLNDLIHVGKTELNQSAGQQRRLNKFREYLREREQDTYRQLKAFHTDEDVQIQVLVEGCRRVNLEDVRLASEKKRTITTTFSHREYKLLREEQKTRKYGYPQILRQIVRHHFGIIGSGN